MDTKDLQIIAQSAGAHAATIVAAAVAAGVDQDHYEAFEALRSNIFYGVLELVKQAEEIRQGAVLANVVQAFPGAQEVAPAPAAAPVPVPPPTASAQQTPPPPPPGASTGGAPSGCPQCGGGFWDNRGNKRNAKAPDFKCKEQNGSCRDKSGQYAYGWWA